MVQEKSPIDNSFIWDKKWLIKQLLGKKWEQLVDVVIDEPNLKVPKKTKLSELVKGDKIFGICLYDDDVYFADYCDVQGYNNGMNPEWESIA
jgi:hypothetical protein